MKIEQISVFLENKAGRLAEVTNILAVANINIKALALADTSEFGILRLIVDKQEEAHSALKANGFTVARTDVVAVEVSHTPGSLNHILRMLEDKEINVEYMYGFPNQGKAAIMIFRFNRTAAGLEVLRQNGVRTFSREEVCSLL